MTEITVTISEMKSVAGTIERAVRDFREAAEQVFQCAEALSETWEGASRDAFIQEQQNANEWYNQMMDIVNDYVTILHTAADDYQTADTTAASIIRGI